MSKFEADEQINYIKDSLFRRPIRPNERLLVSPQDVKISDKCEEQFQTLASCIPDFISGLTRIASVALIDDSVRRASRSYRTIRALMGLGWRIQ